MGDYQTLRKKVASASRYAYFLISMHEYLLAFWKGNRRFWYEVWAFNVLGKYGKDKFSFIIRMVAMAEILCIVPFAVYIEVVQTPKLFSLQFHRSTSKYL